MDDHFLGIKFWPRERNTENMMQYLYFDKESDYPWENTCENEVNIFTPQLLIYYI